jgi:3D (Asp-Asp-Asp) domain-containing protein
MLAHLARACALVGCFFVVGCASSSRSLPKYQKPIARTAVQKVRTTAYTHSESDHIKHGRSTAVGTTLRCGSINSAAADWSRWPVGSIFRIRETGQTFQVDDYGWALAGTNTIDLYKPSRSAMNRWGVRFVTIENLQWGDVDRSLAILRQRSKYKHVRRMIDQIESRYADLKRTSDRTYYASAAPEPIAPEPPIAPVTPSAPVAPAVAVHTPQRRTTASGVVLTPFSANLSR